MSVFLSMNKLSNGEGRLRKPASELHVAVLQWDILHSDPIANQEHSYDLLVQAAASGAQLVVLPELCNSGYFFSSRDEILVSAEPKGGSTEQFWHQIAAELGIVIVGGLAERDGNLLYNSMVMIGSDGELARYRKVHLFDQEKRWFQPGDSLCVVPVLGTSIGLMLCYDGWFPEVPRALALMGAEVIVMAGCVRHDPSWGEADYPPVAVLQMAHAHTNAVFVACSLRNGSEQGLSFSGQSTIWGPQGRCADLAPVSDDAVVSTILPLHQARFKHRTKRVHPLKDRRPSAYQILHTSGQSKS